MTARCDACLDSERDEDLTPDVRRVAILDPEPTPAGLPPIFVRRENLCGDHRAALRDDGYIIRGD